MFRLVFLLLLSSLALAYINKNQDELSPQGDTRMGSDAAATGTDIDDKDLQAQEDQRAKPNGYQEAGKTKTETETETKETELKKP